LEAKANYTLVGLVILTLVGALIATALWLSVGFEKKPFNTYAVYIRETVSGLNEDAAVKYNGVKVGNVRKIKLNLRDPRQVQILLNIEAGTPITNSTYATLISQGITGVSYVGLAASSSDLTPLEKLPDQPYPIIPAKPSLFNQFDKALSNVSNNVNKVTERIQQVLDDENTANFKKILENMTKFSGELTTTIHKVNGMAVDIGAAGVQVQDSMRLGKNTINQISQDLVPSASALLRRLNIIAGNLEVITNTMKQNPAVIIRGSKPPQRGPGE
jgi:phospholipid/cholesterol/gamma-HCH transport system substrate-binding protein